MSASMESQDLLAVGRSVLGAESQALQELAKRLGESFDAACRLVLRSTGRVIVSGMGKSGHIAGKLAASLASTGTAAHFLHPAEAVHGDLGVVTSGDLLLALSYSGETSELLELISAIGGRGVPVIAITANRLSSLARSADVVIELGRVSEADPFDLVPTTSTLLTMAVGDALVVALMKARGFSELDFALYHPKGSLGKRLTLCVQDLLHGDSTNPIVQLKSGFGTALEVISRFKLGATSVVDAEGRLSGLVTDGDVRRGLVRLAERGGSITEALRTPVDEIMTQQPSYVKAEALAYDALAQMEGHKPRPVFVLPVVDAGHRPVGMLHLHALVQAGFRPDSNME